MTVLNALSIVAIPVLLATLALAWPSIQSCNRRRAFQRLILRELEEIAPSPEHAQGVGWWEHQRKDFVHQKIFQKVSKNRDFILSPKPDLVYFVSQLWDAKAKKDDVQWLHFLQELSVPKYDKNGRIGKAREKWVTLCGEYNAKKENSMNNIAYTVFYNAVRTQNGAHLFAVGWCSEGGRTAILQKDEQTSNFRFQLKELGEGKPQVITPFAVSAKIPDPPKSISVEDDYNRYQVQVNGIDAGGSGENTSGKWVKSRKN